LLQQGVINEKTPNKDKALIKKYKAAKNKIAAEICLTRKSHLPDLGNFTKRPLNVPTRIKENPTP
jgi:hypothetical protein